MASSSQAVKISRTATSMDRNLALELALERDCSVPIVTFFSAQRYHISIS